MSQKLLTAESLSVTVDPELVEASYEWQELWDSFKKNLERNIQLFLTERDQGDTVIIDVEAQ